MAKVLVLYYPAYGHIETMAHAVAEGAREAGAAVDVKRLPELVAEEVARRAHFKLDQSAPIARVEEHFFWRETNEQHGPVGGIAPPPWSKESALAFMDGAGSSGWRVVR